MDYSYGNDISYWQGPKPLNFKLAADRGIKLVCIKKSQGAYQDSRFKDNWSDLKTEPRIKRTIYHYFEPTVSAELQIGAIIKDLDPNEIQAPVWLDVERPHYLNKSVVLDRMLKILYAMRTFTGRNVAIYTSKSKFDYYYSNKPGWDREWMLVVANYGPANPALPAGWADWDGWQFSADGNGLGRFFGYKSTSIDMDLLKPQLLE